MSSFATNHRQLSLLPLHPENSTSEYKDNPNDNNMAYFFSSVDGGATTLTNLLRSSTTSSSDNDNNTTNNNLNNCTTLSSSVSLSYGHCEEGAVLVRTALRNKERDTNEEIKWVCYSEVVERRPDEEVTSCVDAADADDDQRKFQRLSLKLDYQDILNAWSDRGPLYIHAESSQIVPDSNHDDDFLRQTSDVARVWRVPEMTTNDHSNGVIRGKQEIQVGEVWKLVRQREASVLRYKEKRHNRLFARRIRYQVRKINAEKRPRIKGRFVKRST